MSLVNIIETDKEKNKVKMDEGLIPSVGYFYVNNYTQLKYDLKYAKDEEIYNSETIHIYARNYKNVLFKFILTESLSDIKEFDYSNEALKNYAKKRNFEHFNISDLDLEKTVTIVIINDNQNHAEFVKKYCFLNSNQDKKQYQMVYRFVENKNIIFNYKLLKDFGPLFKEFNTAMRFDLAATRNGEEE